MSSEKDSPENQGIEDSERSLHGSVSFQKGDSSLTARDLHDKLSPLWKEVVTSWKLVSLGKGYFEFQFSSVEEMRQISALGVVYLKPGLLRFFPWSKDFNPNNHKQSYAQVWVRFRYLPQEYWMPRTLFEIASALGTPLDMDENTGNREKRTFGHYARLLVDVDLSKKLYYSIIVQREGFEFPLEVIYEKLPQYCNMCNQIGHKHNVKRCKKLVEKSRVDSKENQSRLVKHVSKEDIRPNGVSLEAATVEKDNLANKGTSRTLSKENPDLVLDIARTVEVARGKSISEICEKVHNIDIDKFALGDNLALQSCLSEPTLTALANSINVRGINKSPVLFGEHCNPVMGQNLQTSSPDNIITSTPSVTNYTQK